MISSGKATTLRVHAGKQTYTVFLGNRLGAPVYRRALKGHSSPRLFLVFDSNLYACHGRRIVHNWQVKGRKLESLVIPSGEQHKLGETVASIHDWLIARGATRDDVIVACGGGVTSDIVGFAAATIFRGIKWGICATTLLGMADASIGGKTGINHAKGKNLIGAYWQPSFVIDDLQWLSTLPPREFRSGAAEIIKCAGLSGGKLLRLVSQWSELEFAPNSELLGQILTATIKYKASIVAQDERDYSVRMVLNYGHTVGHAIEQSLGYGKLTHGEAVLLGMIAALHVGELTGVPPTSQLAKFRSIIYRAASQLLKVRLSLPDIMSATGMDKKRSARNLQFVLLRQIGKPVVSEVKSSTVSAAVSKMLKELSEI